MFSCLNTGAIGLKASFDEALELAQIGGFAGLDLPLGELVQLAQMTSVEAVKERFVQANIRPGGWNPPVDFRANEQDYRASLEQLPRQAALAQALGSPWCSTWVLPFSDELDYEANRAFHLRRLRPIAQILADYGCRFGLEFVGPKTLRAGHRYEFISSMDAMLEFGDEIGTGNVGLLLDCFHWYTSHGTVEDIARVPVERIVYVHVNDAVAGRSEDEQIDGERQLPGASGVIDIADFLQILARKQYDGPVVVEPFNAEHRALPAAERVKATRESLRSIWRIAGLQD